MGFAAVSLIRSAEERASVIISVVVVDLA